jgi:hypothetical protein
VLQLTPQAPRVQVAVPFTLPHTVPQVPQLPVFVCVLVSHPFTGLPSQSAQPLEHTGLHAPATQEVVPLALAHCVLQAPQCAAFVFRLASQPFCGSPSQDAKPVEHTGAQRPATQDVVPLAFAQALPHAPQLPALVCVLVSHPLFGLPSQLANPGEQLGLQTPALQDVVPLAFVHAAPQAPQLAGVVSWVSQPLEALPSQLPNPAAHAMEQTPAVHAGVPLAPLHAVPHVPQLLTLVCRFDSQPLPPAPSQLPNPALQEETLHAPDAHEAVAFARLQVALHAPQLVFVFSCLSQPLASLPSQLPQPAEQVPTPQMPAAHKAVA